MSSLDITPYFLAAVAVIIIFYLVIVTLIVRSKEISVKPTKQKASPVKAKNKKDTADIVRLEQMLLDASDRKQRLKILQQIEELKSQ